MAQFKNAATPLFYKSETVGIRNLTLRIWTYIDGQSDLVNSLVTQKGMVQFKSAATPFLYNSGTVDIYGY